MADRGEHPWITGRLSPEAERARFTILHASDPLILAQALTVSAAETERLLREAVAEAREAGATWEEIGQAVGTSRQAALRRFGS